MTALKELLALAEIGEITGIAFACSMRRQRYMTNVAGYCYQNPTVTRGMICALADEVATMVHSHNP